MTSHDQFSMEIECDSSSSDPPFCHLVIECDGDHVLSPEDTDMVPSSVIVFDILEATTQLSSEYSFIEVYCEKIAIRKSSSDEVDLTIIYSKKELSGDIEKVKSVYTIDESVFAREVVSLASFLLKHYNPPNAKAIERLSETLKSRYELL